MTKAEVRKLLGPPDDTRSQEENKTIPELSDREAWCYGTSGHLTTPTLGYVAFAQNHVVDQTGRGYMPETPSADTISEEELEAGLTKLSQIARWSGDGDPLVMIRASNFLIGEGQDKALALMNEFYRLESDLVGTLPLFWIVRTTFTSTLPGGVFALPAIGAYQRPSRPRDLQTWPTFPVQIVDDVPLNFFGGVMLMGFPEFFDGYVKRSSFSWRIRTTPLVPTNDPFASYSGIGKPGWRYPAEEDAQSLDRQNPDRAKALSQLLLLVRTAYPAPTNSQDFDKCHQEFLKLRCHWDQAQQKYVRQAAG